MGYVKTYITSEVNIQIKHSNDINGDPAWKVYNVDGSAYDFSQLSDVKLEIFEKRQGSLKLIRPMSATNGISVSGNDTLVWRDQWADINLPIRAYYYALTYTDDSLTHPIVKIVDGILEIV